MNHPDNKGKPPEDAEGIYMLWNDPDPNRAYINTVEHLDATIEAEARPVWEKS